MSWGLLKLEVACLLKYKLRQEYNTQTAQNLDLQARVLHFLKLFLKLNTELNTIVKTG